MTVELETARHRLRPITLDEKAELHALWTDPAVRRWLFDDEVIATEDVDELIAKSDARVAQGMGHWTIRAKSDGRLIGSAALQPIEGDGVELIYLLARSEWGRGHASEASRAILDHAFGTHGLDQVIAQADVSNTASIALMKRLGMRFDRELEIDGLPLVQYVLEREVWERDSVL